MRNLLLILPFFLLASCHIKTPEEAARESHEKFMLELEKKKRAKIDRLDSLYKTAIGYNKYASRVERIMALDELENEVQQSGVDIQQVNIDWDGIRDAIAKDVIYEE